MNMDSVVFVGVLRPSYNKCPECEQYGTYEIRPHYKYKHIDVPICRECDEICPRMRFARTVRLNGVKKKLDIRYNRLGQPISTVEMAIMLSQEITKEVEAGTFKKSRYDMKPKGAQLGIRETLGQFINRVVIHNFREGTEDHEVLKEFMAPHFSEVGIFAASEIHCEQFIKMYEHKFKWRRDYVRELYRRVLSYLPYAA